MEALLIALPHVLQVLTEHAKDVYNGAALALDLGAYVTQDYTDAFRGRFRPALGLGLHVGL